MTTRFVKAQAPFKSTDQNIPPIYIWRETVSPSFGKRRFDRTGPFRSEEAADAEIKRRTKNNA